MGIHTAKGKVLTAKNVIVAIPPYLSGKIKYDPPLNWRRMQMNQHTPMSTSVKFIIKYKTHFWAATQVNVKLYAEPGVLSFCADATPVGQSHLGGYIDCFCIGRKYDTWASLPNNATKEQAVLDDLVKLYGSEARDPQIFEVAAWTRWGSELIKPHGVIQWASEQTSPHWPGHLEGAVIAGKRAAKDVLDSKVYSL